MFRSLRSTTPKASVAQAPLGGPVTTQGFVVLGMHRSGTSCLTGLLETAGLWLGDVRRRNKNNPKGNLENKAVQTVNSAILEQSGGAWDAPPTAIDWKRLDLAAIREALEPYRDQPRWVLKDPRLVLTLEAWLPHLPAVQLVGVFRHPLPVARSLEARNEMPLDQGQQLWLQYNRRLLELHSKHKFPLLCFDLSAAEYLQQFAAVCERLSLPFDPAAAAEFYEPQAVHHVADAATPLSVDVARCYQELLARRFWSPAAASPPRRMAS